VARGAPPFPGDIQDILRAGDADALERVRVKFPTAAIAVLEFTGTWPGLRPRQARLAAFVVPRELRAGAGGG
jgi:phosphohistidine phosphatase